MVHWKWGIIFQLKFFFFNEKKNENWKKTKTKEQKKNFKKGKKRENENGQNEFCGI